MGTLFNRFQTWLLDNRKFLLSRFSTDEQETQEPEKSLIELPPNLASKLVAAVDDLPSHKSEVEAIQSTLDEALNKWLSNPLQADNSVVILSSPVTTVSRILTESLQNWASKQEIQLRPLQWIGRPEKAESIKTKLQQQLGRGVAITESKQPEIVVISNLNWCFLRCVEGLEGIDYLQDVLLQDDSRFWVIGAGKIGWEYLNHVSHFNAYCGETLELPRLTGEQLQAWFEPIVSGFNITFAQPSIEFGNTKENQNYQSRYFEKLASVSQGLNTVATEIFLRSIPYEIKENDNVILEAQNPELPNLPSLDAHAHYILYSLLLHGDLTLAALSESLGDEINFVKGQIQMLRRQGLVKKKHEILTLNPIHYPQLKTELANNNFIIYESH
ncbi:ArsR family transcriptional regulator [Plectonema cf. radiosum LEGE 06105]|uniref:ArsR family transcriptional regulator n=1 Tax=Plectonema cf. radiosum LEGE 06105 TaxID=945769 RepID=A0A8J7JV64_9CYAN|nr:ArsR family transcriptional regulator [Plectonema radiosum]MBE9215444.1 ArsR family transcriptional regulator [Plectonema cf. radiosum LEGE 06105]